MTATFSLKRPDLFPAGTNVDVYELPASSPRPLPGATDAPNGTIKDSAVVDVEGIAAFSGLTEGKRHVAVAEVGYLVELLDGGGAVVATVSSLSPFTLGITGNVNGNWTGGVTFHWNGGSELAVAGPAHLSDLQAYVESHGGVYSLVEGGTPADGNYAGVAAGEGVGTFRRVYFRTPTGAVTSNVGSSVVSYDAAESSRWPSWRTRRRNLGLV